MNLWAKSIRQLAVLTVALFFFSCEDETSTLGFKNPQSKFNVSYIEIPVESSVLLIDSIITDNKGTNSVLVGQYQDNLLGSVKATSFLQMVPSSTTKLDATSVYDSVTFQVRLNFYSYGIAGTQEVKFNIHEITEDSLDRTFSKRYYYNSFVQYNPDPLGEGVVTVDYDSLKKQIATEPLKQDTLLARSKLTDSFGMRLFDLAYNDQLSNIQNFIYGIKGLALTSTQNSGVLGLGVLNNLSKVTLHYHTMDGSAVKDTLERSFVFAGSQSDNFFDPNFTNITTDRSGSELSSITQSYQSFQPSSGLRVVQSGSPVITKLDLKKFYEFADTVNNIVFNSVELIINDVVSSSDLKSHSSLIFKIINNQNDLFTNYNITAEREAMASNYVIRNGNHYSAISDEPVSPPSAAAINYNSSKNQFSGFMTLFIQNLFANKGKEQVNENRIRFFGLYPSSPTISNSVTRTVFNANNVKLRIHYTRPTSITNPD